jgi:hypothetical protein
MRLSPLVPIAALAFAIACNENSSTPVEAVSPGSIANASGSPHFIANGTSCTQQGFNLVCSFKEAGLSAGSTETIQVSVFANAGYGCVNGGGSVPSDPKKSVSGNLTTSGTFTAGKNGNLIGSLTVSPLAANQALSCPPGQTATLLSVTYGSAQQPNATIFDVTSGASIDIAVF